jgi:hypothetical protein
MRTDAQKRARLKYQRKCKRLAITIYPSEPDLLKKINEQESYSAYIKGLIRKDINEGNIRD